MSQRKPPPDVAARPSPGLEPAAAEGADEIMSAILTYIGFNVTKRPLTTKY